MVDPRGLDVEEKSCPDDANVMWSHTDQPLGPEGYTLTVEHDRIVAEAQDAEGAFRAWTTLRQRCGGANKVVPKGLSSLRWRFRTRVPRHRGLLLDCCRHFMAPSFVKDMIDALALQK